MILNKKEIRVAMDSDELSFEPALDEFQVQPNSVDLRTGWTFYIPEHWKYTEEGRVGVRPDYLDYRANQENFRMIKLKPGQYFEFLPNEFVVVSSLEKINMKTKKIMSVLHPRSSMIRRGFVIESGVIDVGYKGTLTIPVFNGTPHPLRLYPGERICQLVFHQMLSELSDDEAQLHGKVKAKYQDSTAYNLEARTDHDDELGFIKQGKIAELKDKFKAS